MTEKTVVNEAMLEIAVNATGDGHDLSGFEAVEDADGRKETRPDARTAD